MTISDPIADMLTRIRNGLIARHDFVNVPVSKIKLSMVKILKREGFIADYELVKGKPQQIIKIYLKYMDKKQPAIRGLKRVSKPGVRIYVQKGEIPRIYGGLGITILSTVRNVVTGEEAWRQKIGGELLCYVW